MTECLYEMFRHLKIHAGSVPLGKKLKGGVPYDGPRPKPRRKGRVSTDTVTSEQEGIVRYGGLTASDFMSFVLVPAALTHLIQLDSPLTEEGNMISEEVAFNRAVDTTAWGDMMHADPDDSIEVTVGNVLNK